MKSLTSRVQLATLIAIGLILPVILLHISSTYANPDKRQKRELGTDLGTLLDPNRRKYEASPRCIALYKRPLIEITKERVQRDCIDPLGIPKANIGKGEYYNPVFDRNGDIPAEFKENRSSLNRKDSRVLASRLFDVTVIKSGFKPQTTVDFDLTGVRTSGSSSVLVQVNFNGRRVGIVDVSAGSRDTFSLEDFGRGANVLSFSLPVVSILDGVTFIVEFDQRDLVGFDPRPGQPPYDEPNTFTLALNSITQRSRRYTLGFPQIGFNAAQFPLTARHVREVWKHPNPEVDRLAPLKPGRSHNPYPTGGRAYARLLTVDRPKRDSRRNESIRNYASCPPNRNGDSQDRDEYPPAVFSENNGTAHIKCILSDDNQSSGRAFGRLLTVYQSRPGVRNKKIKDGEVVEFVLF